MRPYLYEFKKLSKNRKVMIIGSMVIIILAITLSISIRDGSEVAEESIAETDFTCLMDENSQIENFQNYEMKLIVSDKRVNEWGKVSEDNGRRELIISEISNNSSGDKVIMTQRRVDATEIDYSYHYTMQICDSSNNTSPVTYIPDINTDAVVTEPNPRTSVTSEKILPEENLPQTAGKYRIDGLLYNGNRWILVDRMEIEMK